MKLLLTGASGFIGGAFMKRFCELPDMSLLGIGRRHQPDLPTKVSYQPRDLLEPLDVDFSPDVVVHAAALASPWAADTEYRHQNVDVTRNIIDYCKANGLPRLIYTSSSSVFYRNEHQFDLDEASPAGPTFVNTYAATKYAGERLVLDYPGEKIILRPRAVFGPGDTVLFPRILAAAQQGKLPRFIHKGPRAIGDVIYIDTLCDYIMAATRHENPAIAYNLTNAEPVEIEAFLFSVLDALDLPPPTWRVSIKTAMLSAAISEWCYRSFRLRGEPPLTKFGVGVFAYSKTFRPDLTLRDFGPPSVSLAEGVKAFVAWQKSQWQ